MEGKGSKPTKVVLPWTFATPCYAVCKGKAKAGSAYYKGACQPTCDERCAQVGVVL